MSLQPASPFKTKAQREEERTEKRDALIRAAVRMFNDRGFYSTSLDDVAASLGVSKPTVYHYLGNKEQVLLECISRGIEELHEAAAEAAATAGPGIDRLRVFLDRYVRINMDDFGRCVIRTVPEGLTTDGAARFRDLKRGIDLALRELIQDAIDDRSMAAGDVRIIAFTLAGALNWPARWFRRDGPDDAEQVAKQMVDLLMNGIVRGGQAGAAEPASNP
jgi:AcrR family transcriptional regulator